LTEKLSIDTGELTDKGVLSQRNVLRRHAALVEKLYAENPSDEVICLNSAADEGGGRSSPIVTDDARQQHVGLRG
jgi:hypothetical protein